jgi:hypothetical protein
MRTDTQIRTEGLRALLNALGAVEAERFVALLLREPFDYTAWQRTLWPDRSVEEISAAAMAARRLAEQGAAADGGKRDG